MLYIPIILILFAFYLNTNISQLWIFHTPKSWLSPLLWIYYNLLSTFIKLEIGVLLIHLSSIGFVTPS